MEESSVRLEEASTCLAFLEWWQHGLDLVPINEADVASLHQQVLTVGSAFVTSALQMSRWERTVSACCRNNTGDEALFG